MLPVGLLEGERPRDISTGVQMGASGRVVEVDSVVASETVSMYQLIEVEAFPVPFASRGIVEGGECHSH